MNTPEPGPAAEEGFPMRTVSVITGVNPVTLRAWERRYGLIKPARTAREHSHWAAGEQSARTQDL